MKKTLLVIGTLFLVGSPFVHLEANTTGENASESESDIYRNGQTKLILKDGIGRIVHKEQEIVKHYDIENGRIILHMANTENESRPDLELIIENNGEILSCAQCGYFGLSMYWIRFKQ
jgi:hypothetical protein